MHVRLVYPSQGLLLNFILDVRRGRTAWQDLAVEHVLVGTHLVFGDVASVCVCAQGSQSGRGLINLLVILSVPTLFQIVNRFMYTS